MENHNNKKNKYISVIGIILFLYILSKINLRELWIILKNINLFYFSMAILLLFLSCIIGIVKWKLLIDSQDVKIPFKKLTTFFLKGLFWGIITPGKLGEAWKAKYLTDSIDISGGRAFYTVLMDRLIDLIIVILVSLVGIFNFYFLNKIKWSVIILISVVILFIIYFLMQQEKCKNLFKLFMGITLPYFKKRTDSFIEECFNGLKKLNFTLLIKLLICGSIYYLMTVSIYYLFTLALGVDISFSNLLFIAALVSLFLFIPITVLGLGTREVSLIYFFSIFNIKISLAVSFSLLILFSNIILLLPGAILFLKKQ